MLKAEKVSVILIKKQETLRVDQFLFEIIQAVEGKHYEDIKKNSSSFQ